MGRFTQPSRFKPAETYTPVRRFCQGTYDSFDSDQNSKYCGSSRFGKKAFFRKVANKSAEDDYIVDSFLYATSRIAVPKAFLSFSFSEDAWSRESNWIGYIAVSSDEASERLGRREIYVAWRGTIRKLEWVNVLVAKPTSLKPLLKPADTEATSHAQKHHWGISPCSGKRTTMMMKVRTTMMTIQKL